MSDAAGQDRLVNVEIGKFAAACGVAMIHLAPNTPAAESLTRVAFLFPVYFFFSASVFFTLQRASRRGGPLLQVLRLERLLVPYASWTLIYLALRLLSGRSLLQAPAAEWVKILGFGGAAVHLYFLPLLVFFQILAVSGWRLLAGDRRAAGWLLACVLLQASAWELEVANWRHAAFTGLVYALLALAVARLRALTDRRSIILAGTAVLLLGLALLTGLEVDPGWLGVQLRGPLFGALVLLALLRLPQPGLHPRWQAVLSCSYGLYFCHHAFEEGLERLALRLELPLVPYTVAGRLAVTLLVVVLGVLFTMAVRRIPWLAWLLLGEPRPAAR